MVFCDKCGTDLPDDSRFCRKCGYGLTASPQPVTTSVNRKQHVQTFLAVAAIIAGIIILLALPYNGYFWDHATEAFLGVILLAAGLTYLWRRKAH